MAKRRVQRGDPDGVAIKGREAAATIQTESATEDDRLDDDQKAQRDTDAATLKLLRKRIKAGMGAWGHFRKQAVLDMKFRAGTWGDKSFQWLDGVQTERIADGRPCLTINRVPGTIHQITNQARQAHLRIVVKPVNNLADKKCAEVLQGIIRNIETHSFADVAYNTASDKQAEIGFGVFRLLTEYADPNGDGPDEDLFRQRARILRERNPLRILFDPAYEELDASDAQWSLKFTDIDRDDFEDKVGEKPPSEADVQSFLESEDGIGAGQDWFPNGKIRYVEYFSRELHGAKVKKLLLSDGTVIDDPGPEALKALLKNTGVTVDRERWVQQKRMVWRHCTALRVHAETEWTGDAQPWIPVVGDELEIDGERDFRGAVRDSKDPARAYNGLVSGIVEASARGLKVSLIGVKGQFGAPGSETRKAFDNASKKPFSILETEPVDIDGKAAPEPRPVTWEPPIQTTMIAAHQMDEDFKTTSGFHDATLGERGPQESGVAIDERKQQDLLGSSHYLDNLRIALGAAGRQLIKVIRAIYDVPTILRITGDDDRERMVMVYSGKDNDPRSDAYLQTHPGPGPLAMKDGSQVQPGQKIPFQLPDGVSDIFDLSVGEYHVEVDAGPGQGSRREEQVKWIFEAIKLLPPPQAAMFYDLAFQLVDEPVAQQMAERAKKMLPPELQDEQDPNAQLPPAAAAQVAQLKAELAKAMQALQQAKQLIDGELLKQRGAMLSKQAEIASRERIAHLNAQTSLIEKLIEQKGDQAITLLQAAIDGLSQKRDQQHEKDLALLEAGAAEHSAVADRQHDVNTQVMNAAATAAAATAQPSPGGGTPPDATAAPPPDASAPPAAGDAGVTG
jgi:hypothetical protein